ncbi:MAG: YccF domain-containing protein [Bifidobacterium breve]|nr:YccF domain-containing protein [Bifidobacterium breve]
MRVIGNILWIILGGLAIAISWTLIGLFLCITIIGIPLGVQAFKMAGLTLTPFGKTVQYGGGVGSTLVNILWVVLVGWWMALGYALAVRRTDLQSVTIVSAVGPVQRIIIVRCTGLFIYNGHFTHRVI